MQRGHPSVTPIGTSSISFVDATPHKRAFRPPNGARITRPTSFPREWGPARKSAADRL